LQTVEPITTQSVTAALKRYKDENNEFQISSRGINSLKLANNTFKQGSPKQQCTPTNFLGPHPSAKCFKKLENAKAEQEWFEKWGLNPPKRQAHVAVTPDPKPPATANHTSIPTAQIPIKKKSYVFFAYSHEANLVHPKFEAMWDTGASSHMFNDYIFFQKVSNTSQAHESIMTAGIEELKVEASGEVELKGVTIEKFTLQNALYIPALRNNLITAGALKQKGAIEVIDPRDSNKFIVVFNDKTFLRGRHVNNLNMVVQIEPVSNIPISTHHKNDTNINASNTDHNWLGHINPSYLRKTIGCDKPGDICDTCRISKWTKLPFSGVKPYTQNPLDNIHIDLSGIIRIPCIFNYSYFMLIIDEYTRMAFIYFLKTKTKEEVFEAINDFILRAERHCKNKVKMITTDGGGEFINSLLIPFCESLGIVKNTTAPCTPQQNGLVERFMRTIATKA
jgi:hypothetical protein